MQIPYICDLVRILCTGRHMNVQMTLYIQDGTPCSPSAAEMRGTVGTVIYRPALFGFKIKQAASSQLRVESGVTDLETVV